MTSKLVGDLSIKNSSSTVLTGSSTFTGEWEDVRRFDTVSFACRADQTGTLYADFTSDINSGTTDSTLTYKIAANINEVHRLSITRPFFRLRLVNGSTDQTYLSLSTMFGSHPPLSAPLNLSLGLDSDAITVRGTLPEDEIVRGLHSGVAHWTQFAYTGNLTAASGEETVWTATGSTFTPLTSASTFTIAYTNTTDGSGQNGALTLYFQYVDANGLPAITTHTLGSSGSDVTSFTGLGINRIAVSSSGSTQTNGSDITITATTGGSVQAHIPAGVGVTQQAIYFTGSNSYGVGKFLWINANKLSGGGAPRVLIKGYVFNRTVATKFEIFRTTIDTNSTTLVKLQEEVGFRLSPADVLYFVADTDTNNATVNLRFSLREYSID